MDISPQLSPEQERASREVLALLDRRPEIERAFVTRNCANGDLVVTLGVRSIGTCDLVIPASRLTPGSLSDIAALIETMDEVSGRGPKHA